MIRNANGHAKRLTNVYARSPIWPFLKERFAGKENAAPRAVVVTRFNMVRAAPISDRDFRDTVAHLVTIDKKPICTTLAAGYFVAKDRRRKRKRRSTIWTQS